MGVPVQSGGSTTAWSPDGSKPTFPLQLPNDGTLWNFARVMNLIAELINLGGWLDAKLTGSGAGNLASQLNAPDDGASLLGVGAYASKSVAAGTLRAKLVEIWDSMVWATALAATTSSSSGARLVGVEGIGSSNGQPAALAQTAYELLASLQQNKAGLTSDQALTGSNTLGSSGKITNVNGNALVINTELDFSASWGINNRHTTITPSNSVNPAQYETIGVAPPVGAATLTLSTPSITFRKRVRLYTTAANASTITIERASDSTSIAEFTGGAGNQSWCDVEWNNTHWIVVGHGGDAVKL